MTCLDSEHMILLVMISNLQRSAFSGQTAKEWKLYLAHVNAPLNKLFGTIRLSS